MKLTSVRIGGFRNVDEAFLTVGEDITSLVSVNSYGKSNLMNAIDFAVDFIKGTSEKKRQMMSTAYGMPFNKKLGFKNFTVEFVFSDILFDKPVIVNYGFSYSWFKNNKETSVGRKIVKEWLTIKNNEKHQKPVRLILREGDRKLYKSSETGRCSSVLKVEDDALIINKLLAKDDLYYKEIVEKLNDIKIYVERDFDASMFFHKSPLIPRVSDGIGLDGMVNVPRVAYKLKEEHPDKYELLIDSFMQLFPNISKVDVKEVNLGKIHDLKIPDEVPYIISDKVYSMFVVDKNLNQPLNFEGMSDGAKRVFLILTYTVLANINNYHMIALEEPENSIHPSLLQSYLSVLTQLAGDCWILVASHSPYIMQYVNTKDIYIGKPNEYGIANFSKIAPKKINSLLNDSYCSNESVGNYIFELLSGGEDDLDVLLSYLE